jgi:hypothetical protein
MNTSATTHATTSARLRIKLAGGTAGLAIAGIILAACSATSAGAVKPATSAGGGQYHQAAYGGTLAKRPSEMAALRAEHQLIRAAKVSAPVGDTIKSMHDERVARLRLAK